MENITLVYKKFSNLYSFVNVYYVIMVNCIVPAWDLLTKSVLDVERRKSQIKLWPRHLNPNCLPNPQKEDFMVRIARMIMQWWQSNLYPIVAHMFITELSDELLLLDLLSVFDWKGWENTAWYWGSGWNLYQKMKMTLDGKHLMCRPLRKDNGDLQNKTKQKKYTSLL